MIGLSAKMKPRDAYELGVFRKLNMFCKDLRPAFRELRKPTLADQRDHQRQKSGPNGKWAPLSAATRLKYKQMRAHGRKPPRSQLGRLPMANIVKIDRLRMTVTSRVKWSIAQKRGARVGRGATIPGRDYLYVSARLKRQVLRVMLSSWRKRGGQ